MKFIISDVDNKEMKIEIKRIKNIVLINKIQKVLLFSVAMSIVLMTGCAQEEKVEPNYTSLWDNVFSSCGVSCHSASSTDGTENGPDLSSKFEFYNNLYQRSVSTDYSLWIKTGTCDNVNFIAPNDASQSTLAAALVLSVSDSLGKTCDTAYNVHAANNSVISDADTATALVDWINDGAENN